MAALPSLPMHELPPTNQVESPPSLNNANPRLRVLLETLIHSWDKGTLLTIEQVLAPHPDLYRDRDIVLRLITEEMCLRQKARLELSTDDYVRRFPEWKMEIEALAEGQRLLDREVSLEGGGNESIKLRDFQIQAELGRGGQGRVYLATQPFLGGRPVVLKITSCQGSEHLFLARLQHTNIVPLHWAQDYPEQQQRILCMPYFGGTTLAHLLHALKPIPLAQRTGQHILEILDQAERYHLATAPAVGTAHRRRQQLANISYVQAIAWMGSCLAEALQYAHERDLIHLDVKASNVLWTSEGQPMLLDFYLAHNPFGPHTGKPSGLGGTPGFMSPEQQAACAGKPLTQSVDGRSDIYSLGLLLYQALGGTLPRAPASPRLDTVNPQVSPGLADIIERCLASSPLDRYPSAALLANDLRRHLSHLPLRGVSNRSWSERWSKWKCRHPSALLILFMAALVLTTLGLASWWGWSHQHTLHRQKEEITQDHRERQREARKFFEEGKELCADQKYDRALARLQAGIALLPDSPDSQLLAKAMKEQSRIVKLIQHLHAAVDELRLIAIAETMPADIVQKCRLLWEERRHYLSAADKDRRLQQDVIDLVLIWSELAPGQALSGPLEEVNQRWGPNLGVEKALARKDMLLWASPDALPSSASSWERIAWARTLMRSSSTLAPMHGSSAWGMFASPFTGWNWTSSVWQESESQHLRRADEHLRQAMKQDPKNEWAYYYRGICAYRRHKEGMAIQAFSVCIALAPQRASTYYHRGLAHTQRDDFDAALEDYSQALELDPEFASAALNRALIHAQLTNYTAALVDLDYARRKGADPQQVRINRLLIEKRQTSGR